MFSSVIASKILERAGKLVNANKLNTGKELFKALSKYADSDEQHYINHYLKVVDYIESHPYIITLMPQEFMVNADLVGFISDLTYTHNTNFEKYPIALKYIGFMTKTYPAAVEYIKTMFELPVEEKVVEKIEIPLADRIIEFDVSASIVHPTTEKPTKRTKR